MKTAHVTELWLLLVILVVPCFAHLEADLLLANESMEDDQRFLELLHQIKLQHNFHTLFVLSQHEHDCGFHLYLQRIATPTILLGLKQSVYLKSRFNSELLAIVCLNNYVNEPLIESLSQNLHRMRSSRVLFVWKQSSRNLPKHIAAVQHIVQLCQKYQIYRFAVIFQDFSRTLSYYSYQQFLHTKAVRGSLADHPKNEIFPATAKNLYGQKISTASDWVEPRVMWYLDESHSKHLTGYLAKLVLTFTEKVNATLHFPPLNKTVLDYRDLLKLTRNQTIDFAISLSSPKVEVNPEEYTYPAEITAWRPMLPVERKLEAREVYFHIVDRNAVLLIAAMVLALSASTTVFSPNWSAKDARPLNWLQLLINGYSLRAVLGQGFTLPTHFSLKYRFSMLLLLFGGFLISNMYNAYLSSNLTHLPYSHRIFSFEDLLHSSRKIMITEVQQHYLIFSKGSSFWDRYQRCFVTESSVDRYEHMRASLNTSFGYSVLSSQWDVFERQQLYAGRRLFRVSSQMYFDDYFLAAMPIGENSIFTDELNLFISQMISSGLMSYWKSMTFIDMLKAGKLSMIVRSEPHVSFPMSSKDLYWIGLAYVLANMIALLVFGLELLTCWRQKRMSATNKLIPHTNAA